jgi:hypothetical protein
MSRHIASDREAVMPKQPAKVVRLVAKQPPSIHASPDAPLKEVDWRRYAATTIDGRGRAVDPHFNKTCVIMVDQDNRIIDGKIRHW